MNLSASTAAWIAIGAAAAAVVALLLTAWIWLRVQRLRAGQEVLLGGGKGDLVDFAVSLQGRIDDLHRAVDEELTARQRRVFVALVLNGVPLDALVIELESSRNAIYKTMFDARRKLRAALAANGYLHDDPDRSRRP